MISEASRVKIIDNSGAVEGKCIKVIWPKSGHGRRTGKEGDVIVLSVTKSIAGSRIKKGDVMRGLIVRTVHFGKGPRAERQGETLRGKRGALAGYRQSFEDNSVVLVKMGTSSGNQIKKIREVTPIGTRAKAPLGQKVRINKHNLKVTAII